MGKKPINKKVLIHYNKSSSVYVAHFYQNGEAVQKISSYNKQKLVNLKEKFYRGTLDFKEKAETRPTYINKQIW